MILIFSQNAWFNCVICAEDRGAGGYPPTSSMSRSSEPKIELVFYLDVWYNKENISSFAFPAFLANKNPPLFGVRGFLFKTELPMC